MEEILKDELRQGEKILWKGKPENFETLDLTHKKPLINRAIFIITIVALLCIIYAVYAISNNIEVKYILIVVAMFCAVMGVVNGFNQGRKMKKMTYVITDQRIISVLELPKSLEYSQVKEVEFKEDADGHISVLFGEDAIKAKPYQRRALALLDPYIDEESGFCSRFAFYAVPDADNLKNIMAKYIAM